MTDSNRTTGIPQALTPRDITPRTSMSTTPTRKAQRSIRPPSHRSKPLRVARMLPSSQSVPLMTRRRTARKHQPMTLITPKTSLMKSPMMSPMTNRPIQATMTVPKTPKTPKALKPPETRAMTAPSAAAAAVAVVARRKPSRAHQLVPSAAN